MSNRKTIQINPDLFSLTGSKKKGRPSTSKSKPTITQRSVRPNSLKKKLIQRVKEHKLKETNVDKNNHNSNVSNNSNEVDYKTEFEDSIHYLSQLSTNHNKNQHVNKRKQQTRKHYNSNQSQDIEPYVQLELPDDLQVVPPIPTVPENEHPIKLTNHSVNTDNNQVPYGCLKGGAKPTFKSWMKTQKLMPSVKNTQISPLLSSDLTSITQQNTSDRENKLNMLKTKLRQQITPSEPFESFQPINHNNHTNDTTLLSSESNINSTEPVSVVPPMNLSIPTQLPDTHDVISHLPTKTKKTTTRKYKLGKNNKNRTIGVLIKDRKTRKNILDAHKNLKRENITDVKQHLRDHGLIKAGSKSPNDILRKMYESSKMSGNIVNTDNNILMHNFLNENDNT